MPVIVTDSDVLDQIDLNDGEAAEIVAELATLGTRVDPVTLAAWGADLASWRDWETAARARLTGGFWGGEWFGVPADGNTAIAWAQTFDAYKAILADVLQGKTPPLLVPLSSSVAAVSDSNNAGIVRSATGAIGATTAALEGPIRWLAIGVVGVAAIYFLAQRRR